MLLIGTIVTLSLLVGPGGYNEVADRSIFLILIPASIGAAYLLESKFKKYFRVTFLVLLILFTFTLVNQSLLDTQIYSQTKAEYACANYMARSINWTTGVTVRVLSDYRFKAYLTSTLPSNDTSQFVIFGTDFASHKTTW